MKKYSMMGLYSFGRDYLLVYPNPDIAGETMCEEHYKRDIEEVIDLLYDILNNVLVFDDDKYGIQIKKVKK